MLYYFFGDWNSPIGSKRKQEQTVLRYFVMRGKLDNINYCSLLKMKEKLLNVRNS